MLYLIDIFKIINKINWLGKIFNTWKANTRYRQYSKTRAMLI